MAPEKKQPLSAARLNKVVDDVIAKLWSSEAFIEIVTQMVAQGIEIEAGKETPTRKQKSVKQPSKARTERSRR